MNVILVLVFFSIVYFLAHVFAAIFSRTKIPDVLWLIIIGLCLGPLWGVVDPSRLEMVGPIFATLALVIILFESGLGITLDTLARTWSRGAWLTFLNFFVVFVVVGFAASFLIHLSLLQSFLLAAIATGISPAVVIPLLRHLQLQNESITILKLESAVADALCIVAGLALLDANKGEAISVGLLIRNETASFVIACVLGIFAAFFWSAFLHKMRTIQNSVLATPAFVILVFGIAELLECSGYLAALAFGITIGNIELLRQRFRKIKLFKFSVKQIAVYEIDETEKQVFSEFVFLLKTFFFVYIGLSIQLTNLWLLYVGLIITVITFIIRIPVVRFSISKATPVEDVSLIAIMIPKGLAAAALALLTVQEGIAGGEIIMNVAFAIVLFSIVLTSALVFLMHKTPLARFYHLIFSGFGRKPS